MIFLEALRPSGTVDPQVGDTGEGGRIARPGGAKHGVTFVPGLIDDPERNINTAGPLVQFHQVDFCAF